MAYTSPSIISTSPTLAQVQAGLSAVIDGLITANASGTSAPGPAPTVSATGGGATGGGLAAGTYRLLVTETNGIGETTASAEATFTISAGNIARVTFAALQTGNSARNLYLSLAGGATLTEVLYADGITAGTFDLGYSHPALAVPAPSAAPTVATGTTYGGQLLAGNYKVVNTELNGGGESTASAESSQFTVAAQSAPTGTPTVNVTGSGGTLAAGTYKGVITYVDNNLGPYGFGGETLAGTEFSFTQTSGAEPVITFNDGGLPSWASGRNLYLTPTGGAAGTEQLAFTGITGTTYTITTAPTPSPKVPPAANTTSTNQPVVTPAALQPGNTARSYYLTPPGGSSGSEVLVVFDSAASTVTLSGQNPPAGSATPPAVGQVSSAAQAFPAANSTALSTKQLELIRAAKQGRLDTVYGFARQVLTNFGRGEPTSDRDTRKKWLDAHVAVAVLNQAMAEIGGVIDANPGHLNQSVPTAIGGMRTRRQWL